MKLKYLHIFLLLGIILLSCKKPHTYSEIPEIKFKEVIVKDTTDYLDNKELLTQLIFTFVDGDGDIGLKTSDTIYPYDSANYYYNLYIESYEIKNGKIEHINLTNPLRYRMPYVDASGQNKTLKGTIMTDIFYNYPLKYDTILYSFFIYDRSLNKSNIAYSDTIILTQ